MPGITALVCSTSVYISDHLAQPTSPQQRAPFAKTNVVAMPHIINKKTIQHKESVKLLFLLKVLKCEVRRQDTFVRR